MCECVCVCECVCWSLSLSLSLSTTPGSVSACLTLTHSLPQLQMEALVTLETSCRAFPGATKPFAERICSKITQSLLSRSSAALRDAAAACYSATTSCSGTKMAAEAWKAAALACIGSLHSILSSLFSELLEGTCRVYSALATRGTHPWYAHVQTRR